MKKMCTILFASVMLGGCGGTTDDGSGTLDENGFPPVEPGYTRFIAPVIQDIDPGVDAMWCQYVSESFDQDMDVAEMKGWQSEGGHHLIFYATAANVPMGTTRDCTDGDMVSVRFLGGIGGEGAESIGQNLPAGAKFRIPKGYRLMANTHFLNAGSTSLDGRGYLDLKLTPADPDAKTLAMFVNINQNIAVPPHQTGSLDATCVAQQELDLYLFGNHLHEHGKSIYTEVLRKDGAQEMVLEDKVWYEELTFNPKLKSWSIDNPLHINIGDTIRTHCEWNNTTMEELAFPREMCVGFGLFLGDHESYCIDGVWDAQ